MRRLQFYSGRVSALEAEVAAETERRANAERSAVFASDRNFFLLEQMKSIKEKQRLDEARFREDKALQTERQNALERRTASCEEKLQTSERRLKRLEQGLFELSEFLRTSRDADSDSASEDSSSPPSEAGAEGGLADFRREVACRVDALLAARDAKAGAGEEQKTVSNFTAQAALAKGAESDEAALVLRVREKQLERLASELDKTHSVCISQNDEIQKLLTQLELEKSQREEAQRLLAKERSGRRFEESFSKVKPTNARETSR